MDGEIRRPTIAALAIDTLTFDFSLPVGDVSAAIRAYAKRIGHVQIADAPGRGEPGTGQLPLGSQLEELSAMGYAGYIGLEYKATRPDAFDWLPRADRGAHGVTIETLLQQRETRIS